MPFRSYAVSASPAKHGDGIHLLITSDGAGGVGIHTETLAAALQARGHRVTRACWGTPSPGWSAAGADLLLPGPLEWESERDLPALEASIAAGRATLAHFAAHAPDPIDVLHCNQFAWAGAVPGVPSVVAAHSDVVSWWRAVHGTAPPANEYHRWYIHLVRQALEQAAAVVAPTQAALADLRESYHWQGAATVIAHGSDFPTAATGGSLGMPRAERGNERQCRSCAANRSPPSSDQHRGPQRAAQGWQRERPSEKWRATTRPRQGAVCAGRLGDAGKQAHLLLQPGLPLLVTLAGTPPPGVGRGRTNLPGVHYAGPLGRQAMAELLARSRIYVAPSRYEPFGLAPLAAARAGCCLLLNDLPSFRETWGAAAYYFARNDGSDLRRWLQRLAANDALAAAGAAAAHRRALALSAPRMAMAYEALYQQISPGVTTPA